MSATALAEAIPMAMAAEAPAPSAPRFGDVLDAIDLLPIEDQEQIVDIIRHRLAALRHEELVADVLGSRQDFADGLCKVGTVEEIMREALS